MRLLVGWPWRRDTGKQEATKNFDYVTDLVLRALGMAGDIMETQDLRIADLERRVAALEAWATKHE